MSIASLSSSGSHALAGLGAYERNVRAYGPVTATAIGAAQALADGASSSATFSQIGRAHV